MTNPLDSVLGLHTKALGVWQQRAETIAANLANADTPGFQARDIDFRKVLADASAQGGALELETPNRAHLDAAGTSAGAVPLAWRTPLQPSMDGNTVDAQVEQAAFAGNSVHYQASLTFISAQIRMLRTAITGGG